jgi:hypothetical protein
MFRRLLLLTILAALASVSTYAQEVEDTIKIKTRVVFLDALVKDKKSNLPVSNLAPENFEVLDDGKPRNISYFTREGQARKPLALIMILDLREDGAGRFLNGRRFSKRWKPNSPNCRRVMKWRSWPSIFLRMRSATG